MTAALYASQTEQAALLELTTAQRLLWMGQKLAPESPLYNMAFLFVLTGELDTDRLQAAFRAVVARSDVLRTVIEEVGGSARQRVLTYLDYSIPVLDFSGRENPAVAMRDWALAQSRTLFDLSERLFDVALIRLGPDCVAWYLNQHHLITDISSVKLLFETVGDFYQRSVAEDLDSALALPAYASVMLPVPSERAVSYWQQIEPEPVALYQRMSAQLPTKTRRVSCELGPERTAALKALALASEATALTPALSLFNLVAGILFAYLYRVSETNGTLAMATPAHGRPTRALKETLGVFIELFPLLAEVDESETFATLLSKVNAASGALLRHAEPGASEFAPKHDVTVVLNFIHAQLPRFAGCSVQSEWIHPGAGDPRHHLRLQVHDFDGRGSLQLHFDFNEALFERRLQERAPEHFLALVDAILADRHQLIAAVELLGEDERSHLMSLGRCQPVSVIETVVQQFETQVENTPDAIAVTCEEKVLTYRQLNIQANQLAHCLRRQGVSAETPIGICLLRSPEILVAILAVLKAGGAYVPIDPAHPDERISYILKDTQVQWLLTHAAMSERLAALGSGALTVVSVDTLALSEQPDNNLLGLGAMDQLAYLLYTSGSTGQPKGVAVEHRGLANYVRWAGQQYVAQENIEEPFAFPLFSPLTFDLTVTSIYVPLVTGGQIVIYPEGDGPIDLSLQRIVAEDRVDVIKLTPSHLALLQGMRLGKRVKTLILGGEDLKSSLTSEIAAASDCATLTIYNEYGPTEATVGCMIHRFDPAEGDVSVPIGKPAAGADIYLLDGRLQLVPKGAVGEIFVGGPGLARDYLNRPELTAERFVSWAGKRLYRTGDLGRWREDGVLMYLGRGDRQVKIRGHRIELGEIEAAVAAHPAVGMSAVRVVQPTVPAQPVSLSYCTRCGLASNYPGVSFDRAGVCDVCRAYETYRHRTEQYFRSFDELRSRLNQACNNRRGDYDCMMLLSGGKDSTYALAQLVHMGYQVFAFTLDNGYISEEAKENIRRVVQALEVDHVFGTTPAMNEIFVDSLNRHCNVCNGCFKTIYTLSMQMAQEMGIACIVTGLSRGQFFETRLSEAWFTELFGQAEFDPARIDETILEARKVYHRSDDAVSQLMDVSVFESDDIFEAIEIVDFYRYCDVELAEMLAFLRDRLPWIRPADTGRSTNCLINNAGIYVHTQQRGYHNYALPYSWDVRMGHKTVDECIDELNDEINVGDVKKILKEIGYDLSRATEAQLAAYYVVKEDVLEEEIAVRKPFNTGGSTIEDEQISAAAMRVFLAQRLPSSMVPAYLIPLTAMPLTANGKVDVAALPDPQTSRPELASTFVAPQGAVEETLARLWQQVLSVDRIGVHDNFFDLGGDSIMAIQIAARLAEAGFALSPNQVFQHPTLHELSAIALPEIAVETEDLSGKVPLTPIQQAFFDLDSPEPEQFTQMVLLEVSERLNFECLREAVNYLVGYHDSLRLSYQQTDTGWVQCYQSAVQAERTCVVDVSHAAKQTLLIADKISDPQRQLNLASGDLLRAVLFEQGDSQQLALVIHHLAVDAVSWMTLVQDLETVYGQLSNGEEVLLPPKTSSFKAWSEGLKSVDISIDEKAYWESLAAEAGRSLAVDDVSHGLSKTISRQFDRTLTQRLLQGDIQGAGRDRPQEKILAALSMAIASHTGHATIRVDLEGHGREESLVPGARLVRTVGWFTSLFPVVLSARGTIAETLKSVKTTLRAVPNGGIGYGILRYLGDGVTVSQLKAQPQADVLFNYLGVMDQLLPAKSIFRLVKPLSVSRSAQQQRPHALDVSAFVVGGRLQVDWCYGGLDESAVQALADSVMVQLKRLLEGPTDNSVAAEDFPLANLNSQKLDKLAALLGKLDGEVG
ncbi:MAG: amino acid adenylation domain-containing protein [Cyanobacteria bacterium J06631_12]